MTHDATDYQGNVLRIGDYARNIESGWTGRIESFVTETYAIDDDHSATAVMCKMIGVDWIALMAGGLALTESLSSNNVEWHAAEDLERVLQCQPA